MLYHAEFFDKRNEKQRDLTCSKVEMVDGYWTVKKMLMKNVQTGHSTLLEMQDIKFGLDLSDTTFTQSALERGIK